MNISQVWSSLLATSIALSAPPAVWLGAPALILSGCNRSGEKNSSELGTFAMGNRVQVGPFSYNVLEAQWRNQVTEGATAKLPAHRFLLIRISVTNGGGEEISVPSMSLETAAGNSFYEVTEGMQDFPQWFGVLRKVKPAQTETGTIVFDAPPGSYKLRLGDGGEIGAEKTALVEIPLEL